LEKPFLHLRILRLPFSHPAAAAGWVLIHKTVQVFSIYGQKILPLLYVENLLLPAKHVVLAVLECHTLFGADVRQGLSESFLIILR
jgi:hypothetical protein